MENDSTQILFIALCKIYDNYITPLNCNVKCWKINNLKIAGMSITEFSGPPSLIIFRINPKYYNYLKVIELDTVPFGNVLTEEEKLLRLLRL
jgi:hypothetical protein